MPGYRARTAARTPVVGIPGDEQQSRACVAPASPRSHSSTVSIARSRSMSSLWPTAIRNICGAYSDGRVEAVAIAIRREAPDRCQRLVAQRDQPALLAARTKSSPLTSTESSGKSSKLVTQRGFALHGRIPRSPKNASVSRALPRATHDDRLVALRVPARHDHGNAGEQLSRHRRHRRHPTLRRAAARAGRTRRRSGCCR